MVTHTPIGLAATLVVVASIAALTDVRKGVIPNWLTLPVLCGAPLLYGLFEGLSAFGTSFFGLGICGFTPFILFTRRAIGGGDVKFFAAIGAIAGVQTGMEIQLLSFLVAAVYSLGRLVWEGKLVRTLLNVGSLLINWMLPRTRQRDIRSETMSSVRLGGAVLIAVLWVIMNHYPCDWGLR
jgi:prepilin peptidase CpaA